MKATTIIARLERLADAQRGMRTSSAYRLIRTACETGRTMIRPCWQSGCGRFTTNMDYTADTCSVLDALRVRYVRGNDAPRGGKTGNYIKLLNLVK